jgi:plastocyanin
MRPCIVMCLAGLLGLSVWLLQGNSAAQDPAAAARVQIVEVRASEFRFEPHQVMVRSGVIRFVVRNVGEVRHVLTVEWEGGGGASVRIAPGQTQTLEVTLEQPGAYAFFCPLETEGEGYGVIVHRDKGMEGRLMVAQE